MKILVILTALLLSACATASVSETAEGKIITIPYALSDNNQPSENARNARLQWFSSNYVTETFEYEAAKACPNGYVVTKKRFIEEANSMTWAVKCD